MNFLCLFNLDYCKTLTCREFLALSGFKLIQKLTPLQGLNIIFPDMDVNPPSGPWHNHTPKHFKGTDQMWKCCQHAATQIVLSFLLDDTNISQTRTTTDPLFMLSVSGQIHFIMHGN